MDVHKGVSGDARSIGQRVDGFFNQVALEERSFLNRNGKTKLVGVEFREGGINLDRAEVVLTSFIDGHRDVEVFLVRCQFSDSRVNAEIIITIVLVELAQFLAVIFQTAGVVVVVGAEEAPQAGLARHDLAAQARVRHRPCCR